MTLCAFWCSVTMFVFRPFVKKHNLRHAECVRYCKNSD
jgi:hypothetical protein